MFNKINKAFLSSLLFAGSQLQTGTCQPITTEAKDSEMHTESYPYVNIINSTPYVACGTVHYASIFCKNDNYCVSPYSSWTASSRGVCLVTKIDGIVQYPGSDKSCSVYSSSGTSYSQFTVIDYQNAVCQ
eukprot:Pgem_evm1s4568